MHGEVSLAVVILTYNESIHLQRALDRVAGFAQEIFVIDSGSTDNTVELAKSYGARVLHHPFRNYAQQFQWALANAPIAAEWVMRLDADEIVEADLAAEIVHKLPHLPPHVTGIVLNRKTIFMGKFIRHGGRYPMLLLRIWRRGKAHIEDRWMDEHMVLNQGQTVNFHGGFADHNLNDLTYFTEKHNKYASREALDVYYQRSHAVAAARTLHAASSSRQAAVKRFLKEALFNRAPFELAACAYFLFRYIVLGGFLDGRCGLMYHTLQGFWYRYLVGAKLCELEQAAHLTTDPTQLRDELLRLTHLRLD
jgi:glycosyltransferase involved in cell wall biosynthesis